MRVTRRNFLAAGMAGALVASAPRAFAANDELGIAILGAGWRGGQLIPQFARIAGVRIVSVCDPDSKRAAEKAKQVQQVSGQQHVNVVADLRRVLDDKTVDAVVVATPNHWHALATIWACEAGKDVYVEKPVGHNLWESRQMLNAAAKYDRIVQGGTHRRSFDNLHQIMRRIHGGEFGRIIRARACVHKFRESIGRRTTPLPIPPEVDYNLWAGPAPMSPLYRNELHYDWHWMWATGNGELANNGAHMLDLARWALAQPNLAPTMVSVGGRFHWNDAGETPNMQAVYFDYKPAPLIAEVYNLPEKPGTRDAGRFRGMVGWFAVECQEATIVGSNHVEVLDRNGNVTEKLTCKKAKVHPANFISAVRRRSTDVLTCPIPVAHTSCGLALQGNISHRLGKEVGDKQQAIAAAAPHLQYKATVDRMLGHLDALGVRFEKTGPVVGPVLAFDTSTERFTGEHSNAANHLMRRATYRKPFVVPEVDHGDTTAK